jgi:radical SAM protein with 4Fe4S-binding SPASM domain
MASYELFHTVLKALAPNAFYTTIYFQGEPLLHPHFEEFVRMAKEHKLYTATSTNAHFLDEVNAQALVIAGLNRLIISLDGLDQKTYEKYRRGGDLQKVTEGIKTIRRARTELKALTPLIVVQFIVMKHNEHQMNDVRKFAYDLGADVVELKTAQIYDMNDPNEIIPINSKYSRYNRDQNGLMHLKSSLPNHCFRVWSSTVISWDGKVLPCCYDKDGDNAYGNLSTTDFESIISSNQASGFQHRIFSGRKEIEICRNCPEK